MHTAVTGATGLVGNAIARALLARGDSVRALVRDPSRATQLLPPGAEPVPADVTAGPEAIAAALGGAEVLFHAAGIPESWQRDESIFDRVNRLGTRNALQAARLAGVRRVVYTSTMDVFRAPRGGTLIEGPVAASPEATAYERSKVAAQLEADRAAAGGLDVVSVTPAAVYGPAPVVTGLNAFLQRLLAGKVPALPPGGFSVVTADGLATAHLSAARSGTTGGRYLVADGYTTIAELARAVAHVAGLPHIPATAPAWLLVAVTAALAPVARALHFTPLLAPGELSFALWQARVDARKARRELGFVPTPIDVGVEQAVHWLLPRAAAPLPLA